MLGGSKHVVNGLCTPGMKSSAGNSNKEAQPQDYNPELYGMCFPIMPHALPACHMFSHHATCSPIMPRVLPTCHVFSQHAACSPSMPCVLSSYHNTWSTITQARETHSLLFHSPFLYTFYTHIKFQGQCLFRGQWLGTT